MIIYMICLSKITRYYLKLKVFKFDWIKINKHYMI